MLRIVIYLTDLVIVKENLSFMFLFIYVLEKSSENSLEPKGSLATSEPKLPNSHLVCQTKVSDLLPAIKYNGLPIKKITINKSGTENVNKNTNRSVLPFLSGKRVPIKKIELCKIKSNINSPSGTDASSSKCNELLYLNAPNLKNDLSTNITVPYKPSTSITNSAQNSSPNSSICLNLKLASINSKLSTSLKKSNSKSDNYPGSLHSTSALLAIKNRDSSVSDSNVEINITPSDSASSAINSDSSTNKDENDLLLTVINNNTSS